MNKNTIISERIFRNINAGMTARQAIDAVLGEGAWERLAGELYDALRAQGRAAN